MRVSFGMSETSGVGACGGVVKAEHESVVPAHTVAFQEGDA